MVMFDPFDFVAYIVLVFLGQHQNLDFLKI
jgi:hypothetical protein